MDLSQSALGDRGLRAFLLGSLWAGQGDRRSLFVVKDPAARGYGGSSQG